MPSMFRVAAVAAFAAFASAQFTNTSSSALPVASSSPKAIQVSGWQYDGCFSVTANTGSLVETSPFMTVERCLLDCSAYQYARISGQDCFCASSTNGTAQIADALCSTPCPANSAEACGGPALFRKRQAPGTVVSVYQRLAIVPAGAIYVTVVVQVYVDYCATCPGGLTTVTYHSLTTLTGCGCTNPPVPTIPMTTVVTTCPVAGSTTTLTLTVPTGVVPGTVTVPTVTAPITTVTTCPTCPGGVSTVTVSVCPGCASTPGLPDAPKPTLTIATCPPLAVTTAVVPVPVCPGGVNCPATTPAQGGNGGGATVTVCPGGVNCPVATPSQGGNGGGATVIVCPGGVNCPATTPAKGGNGSPTVTVCPGGANCPVASVTRGGPVQYTGAAMSLKAGSGLMAGALVIVAML